jgi:hypothetical protein
VDHGAGLTPFVAVWRNAGVGAEEFVTLRWILDDHPLAIGGRVARIFRHHWAKADGILTDSVTRQHNSGSEEFGEPRSRRHQGGAVRFVSKPVMAVSLAGAGALVVVVVVRRIRRR